VKAVSFYERDGLTARRGPTRDELRLLKHRLRLEGATFKRIVIPVAVLKKIHLKIAVMPGKQPGVIAPKPKPLLPKHRL
jgi:hypothetical protein